MELAESGELQSAESKVGPFTVNPHYYENPQLVRAVGFFMNTIVPMMQEIDPLEGSLEETDFFRRQRLQGYERFAMTSVSRIADRAGYLVKIADYSPDDPDSTLTYQPTRNILDIEPREVFIGKRTAPELRGCLGGVTIGATTGVTVGVATGRVLTGLAAGGFAASGAMKLGEAHGKLVAGREAYKYYRVNSTKSS